MSIRITNFTIEKARNGYILDNDNTGRNVFLDKESISDFVSKSLVNSLNYKDADSFSIQIEIIPIPKIKTVTAKQGGMPEDTRVVSETRRIDATSTIRSDK